MHKEKVRPCHFYVPFTRAEQGPDDSYIVEGYAFVNEVVKGEGGIRIKRGAMEAATPDYMKFANIREMHGKNAAGVALWANWDGQGCHMRAKIVDPVAALKCREGVYKGFSIGIMPTLMRGKDVDALDWLETSLVDRPKDPDALFVAYRVEDCPEEGDCVMQPEFPAADADPAERGALPGEPQPEEPAPPGEPAPSDPEVERGQTSETVPSRENLEGKCKKCGAQCRTCHPDHTRGAAGEALLAPARDEEITRLLAVAETRMARVQELEAEQAALTERLGVAQADLAGVQARLTERDGELSAAKERITTLEKTPATGQRPVLYPQALTREFLANRGRERALAVTAKAEELDGLMKQQSADPGEQQRIAARINLLKQEIAALA
jgi:hypothetical protein